jgi:hypothetical protein
MNTTAPDIDLEEFWEDLLARVEDKQVIPVIGADILNIDFDGKQVPLYRAVADQLLIKYGLSATNLPANQVLGVRHELNDAVCILAANGQRIRDLYRPINSILRGLLLQQKIPQPLCELAAIHHFDLFATTTPDDLLARALDVEHFGGLQQTQEIEYAPNLPTNRRRDIPEKCSSNYRAVFYLFGKADVSPFFAIHDEDALEFPFRLQAGNGPERMFSELQNRSLLLIGCTFDDWLNFLLIRLSNSERLASDRTKREFLVGEAGRNKYFTVFLQRFSPDSRCYSIDASVFVAELYRRWRVRNPAVNRSGSPNAPPTPSIDGDNNGDIFISYATEDIGAARRLFAELQEIGGDVVWLDKSALRPGDDWDKRLRSAVQRCNFFLPLISANTEDRTEGYFRREWYEAEQRSKSIARKFIFPIVIDPDYAENMNRYALVPDVFRRFQFSKAPAGQMSDELKVELQKQLRELRRHRAV